MTTYVIPERYAWAASHGYHRQPGVKIGTCLRGVRFGDEDEVVIIGRVSPDVYNALECARLSSVGVPKMTYIAGERIERPVVRSAEKAQIAAYRLVEMPA